MARDLHRSDAAAEEIKTTPSPLWGGRTNSKRSEEFFGWGMAQSVPHPDRFALRPPHKGEVVINTRYSPACAGQHGLPRRGPAGWCRTG
jgi:hypothetical protein